MPDRRDEIYRMFVEVLRVAGISGNDHPLAVLMQQQLMAIPFMPNVYGSYFWEPDVDVEREKTCPKGPGLPPHSGGGPGFDLSTTLHRIQQVAWLGNAVQCCREDELSQSGNSNGTAWSFQHFWQHIASGASEVLHGLYEVLEAFERCGCYAEWKSRTLMRGITHAQEVLADRVVVQHFQTVKHHRPDMEQLHKVCTK